MKEVHQVALQQARNPNFERLRCVLLRESMPDAVPFYDLFADQEVVRHATQKAYGDESVVEFF